MGELGQHGEGDAVGLGDGAAPFEHGEPVLAIGAQFGLGQIAHDVVSRTSVRKPLSARSCSIATTSVAITSRGAAYFATSSSMMAATLRAPSHSFSTSTAISSGASTRSGARITQTCRVSSNFSLACRGNFGRLASLTLMLRLKAIDR